MEPGFDHVYQDTMDVEFMRWLVREGAAVRIPAAKVALDTGIAGFLSDRPYGNVEVYDPDKHYEPGGPQRGPR